MECMVKIGRKILTLDPTKKNKKNVLTKGSTITHYTNLQQHSEFLCSKHVVKDEYSTLWGVMCVAILLLPVALIVFLIQWVNSGYTNAGSVGNAISLIVFLGVTPIILLIVAYLIRKRKAQKDIRCDEDEAAEKIISKIKKLNSSSRLIF